MSLTLESFSLFVSALVMAVLVRYAWQRRHEPPSRAFAVAMCFGVIWALEIALELAVPNQEWKLLLVRLRPLAHLGIFTSLTLAMVQLVGVGPSRRRHYAVLLLVPAITLALSFGAESHRLFRFHYRVEQYGSVLAATSDKGPWNNVLIGYEYLLVAIASMIVLRAALTARAEYRRVTLAMGSGWLSVVVISFLEQSGGIAGKWGASSYAMAFATVVTGWAVLRRSALELIPLARGLAIDQMSGLLFVLDRRGKLVDCNLPATKALGLPPKAWREKPIDTMPEPWGKLLAGAIRWEKSHGRTEAGQTGDRRLYEWSVSPLQDGQGQPTGHAAFFQDITEDCRAEEALRESEQRFQSLADTAPVMIWVSGLDKRCTFFNKPWLDFTGRTLEQELGKGWTSGVHPEDLDRCRAIYSSSFDDRRNFQMEYRLRRADGEYRWILNNGKPLYQGEFAGFVGSCIDITTQRLIEELLRASEVRHTDAQRLAKVGSWERHADTGRIHWSDEMYRIYGMPNVPSNFAALLNHVHPTDRNKLLEKEAQVHSKNGPVEVEFRLIRPDGEVRFVHSVVEAIRNAQGVVVRIVGATQDITERKRTEEALRSSEQRLELSQEVGGIGTWDWDATTGETHCSSGYGPLYGLPPSDLAPPLEQWLELIYPEDRAKVREGLSQALERSDHLSAEFRVVWPDGTIHWLYAKGQVFRDSLGKAIRVIGVNMDISERKRAEVALSESEERFRNMADAAPVMIWVSGPDKLCTFFSKPWLNFTGRTLHQELGRGWTEGVHPDDLDRCRATYFSSFDDRRAFQIECRLRRSDGEYRWLLNNGTPLYRGGEFVGFIGSCVDITEQKLIQERLLASEIQLKDAQRLAKVGSWERQIDTGISQWSDENRRMLGVSSDAPANLSTFINCVHPKDREKVLEVERKVRTTGDAGEVQYRIIRPDGEVRLVHAILEGLRNDQGRVVRMVGASQDVTEQIEASERLRQSEDRLKNAERIAHLGHWQWDLRANRVSGSEEMYRIFRKPLEYIPSYEGVLAEMIPEDAARFKQLIEDSLTRIDGNSMDYRIVQPNGDLQTISCIWEVLADEEGLPVQIFGTCQDITDSRRAQEESLARQKLETVGALASGIAHDFNNLLGAVQAQAELAQMELAAGSSPEGELKAICAVALGGSEIVRQLMVYAGKESAALGLFDVSRNVEEMLALLKVSISKHARLETDLEDGLPAVRANASQISQLVMNLVTNASEAIGDRDGTVRLTTRRMIIGPGSRQIERLAAGEYVQLEVSDTGCGMPLETQAKVFDPFFTTKSPGRGLGLAVVQGIVRGLGGDIHLESEPGQGTTVQILLPGAQTAAGTMQGLTSDVGQPVGLSRPATVLLVEDEDQLREAASKMLGKQGLSVIEARDGSAALEAILAQQNSIDVLFLDITLPGAPSREILSAARRVRPEMRVIATSAYSEEMTVASLQGTTERFIRKPYLFSDLLNLIREVLS